MFTGASNLAEGVDRAFAFIFIIALIFIVGITLFMIYTVIHFARKKGKPAMQFTGSLKLEILWTVIPLILVMLMFYFGWAAFAPMRNAPADAIRITAIGRKWEWEFDYGNGMKSKELVIPVNKPVNLDLKSEDINHSLFIPAFRVKEDVIPGYNNFLWFIPNYIGSYEILCTEYCGLLHSAMLSKAVVVEQAEYDKWFADLKNKAVITVPEGFTILRNSGCLACHTIDGTKLVGPSFKGLFGSERTVLANNNEVKKTADENYIIKSVYDPDADVVSGFNKGLMKSYKGIITEADLITIINYLKTLDEKKQ
jgi:cytochrome c oxidase subunit II